MFLISKNSQGFRYLLCRSFYDNAAPMILTQEMLNASDCKLRVVADISCDVNGPIACTLRSSTIEEPIYGYFPLENKEVDVFHPAAIVVMAVDNLPCEIQKMQVKVLENNLWNM
jgi:hypothetical protein